jgi:hypothetical protein
MELVTIPGAGELLSDDFTLPALTADLARLVPALAPLVAPALAEEAQP